MLKTPLFSAVQENFAAEKPVELRWSCIPERQGFFFSRFMEAPWMANNVQSPQTQESSFSIELSFSSINPIKETLHSAATQVRHISGTISSSTSLNAQARFQI